MRWIKILDLLFIGSIIGSIVEVVKEKFEPVIPAENWANMKLYNDDVIKGVSIEQRMKNLKRGKYKLTETEIEKYPEPHRDSVDGKIIIENCKLYNEDVLNHDTIQVMKWVEQGKYNLTPEELEKENKRIEEEFERLYNI